MSLRTYSHQLAALNAKAVKAWLQDASWKGRANKNNPRFYADVPADDSGPFAAIRKAIRDAINKAERKKRQKGKKCALVKMYAIFTKTGGFHAPHGDGSRGGMAGYKLRYVMKVGGTGKTGRIHLKMKGEEEMAYEYEAAYSMDADGWPTLATPSPWASIRARSTPPPTRPRCRRPGRARSTPPPTRPRYRRL